MLPKKRWNIIIVPYEDLLRCSLVMLYSLPCCLYNVKISTSIRSECGKFQLSFCALNANLLLVILVHLFTVQYDDDAFLRHLRNQFDISLLFMFVAGNSKSFFIIFEELRPNLLSKSLISNCSRYSYCLNLICDKA